MSNRSGKHSWNYRARRLPQIYEWQRVKDSRTASRFAREGWEVQRRLVGDQSVPWEHCFGRKAARMKKVEYE